MANCTIGKGKKLLTWSTNSRMGGFKIPSYCISIQTFVSSCAMKNTHIFHLRLGKVVLRKAS